LGGGGWTPPNLPTVRHWPDIIVIILFSNVNTRRTLIEFPQKIILYLWKYAKHTTLRTAIFNTWNSFLTAKHAVLNLGRFSFSGSNIYRFANPKTLYLLFLLWFICISDSKWGIQCVYRCKFDNICDQMWLPLWSMVVKMWIIMTFGYPYSWVRLKLWLLSFDPWTADNDLSVFGCVCMGKAGK